MHPAPRERYRGGASDDEEGAEAEEEEGPGDRQAEELRVPPPLSFQAIWNVKNSHDRNPAMVLAVFHCCQGICSLPVEGLCNREGSASDGEELEVAEEEEGPGDRQAEELWARHTSASLVLSDLEHDKLVISSFQRFGTQ